MARVTKKIKNGRLVKRESALTRGELYQRVKKSGIKTNIKWPKGSMKYWREQFTKTKIKKFVEKARRKQAREKAKRIKATKKIEKIIKDREDKRLLRDSFIYKYNFPLDIDVDDEDSPFFNVHIVRDILKRRGISGRVRILLTGSIRSKNGKVIKKVHTQDIIYKVPNKAVYSWWNNTHKYTDWIINSDVNKFIGIYDIVNDMRASTEDMLTAISTFDNPDEKVHISLVFMKPSKLSDKKIVQRYAEGLSNCVLKPIMKWATTMRDNVKSDKSKEGYKTIINKLIKYEKQYPNGMTEAELIEISESIKVGIKIHDVLRDEYFKHIPERKRHVFNYCNTRINHVDNMVTSNAEPIQLNFMKMITKQMELDRNKEFYTYFMKNDTTPSYISTLTDNYVLIDDYRETCEEFNDEIGINKFVIDEVRYPELSEYIRAGCHVSACVDYIDDIQEKKKDLEYTQIDQKKSYTQFKSCGYYVGFPSKFTDFRKVNLGFDEIDEFVRNNVGYFTVENFDFTNANDNFREHINKLGIYNASIVLPSPEILYLIDNNVTFNITSGAWSVTPFHFEFNNKMTNTKDREGRSYYAMWSGKLYNLCDEAVIHCKADKEYATALKQRHGDRVAYWEKDRTLDITTEKTYKPHKSHVFGYITSYSRIHLLKQLNEMDASKVLRVNMDGIYYIDHDIEVLDTFRVKEENIKSNGSSSALFYNPYFDDHSQLHRDIGHHVENSELEFSERLRALPEFKDTGRLSLHLGCGGGGKTYSNMNDKGHINVMYTAPSWKLTTKKRAEFPDKKATVWQFITGEGCEPRYVDKINVLIVDEITMMSGKQRNKIIEMYPYTKIIFCGDIDKDGVSYQLPPHNKKTMKIKKDGEYIGKVFEYNINYRAKCDELKEILTHLRTSIKEKKDIDEMTNEIIETMEKKGKVINKEQAKDMYGINDYILCSKHKYINRWTDKLNDKFKKNKYLVTKKMTIKVFGENKTYYNGDIITSDTEMKGSVTPRHAFTIHQIQGETIEECDKIFIDTRGFFATEMLYTAISRGRTLDQIYLIK